MVGCRLQLQRWMHFKLMIVVLMNLILIRGIWQKGYSYMFNNLDSLKSRFGDLSSVVMKIRIPKHFMTAMFILIASIGN